MWGSDSCPPLSHKWKHRAVITKIWMIDINCLDRLMHLNDLTKSDMWLLTATPFDRVVLDTNAKNCFFHSFIYHETQTVKSCQIGMVAQSGHDKNLKINKPLPKCMQFQWWSGYNSMSNLGHSICLETSNLTFFAKSKGRKNDKKNDRDHNLTSFVVGRNTSTYLI